MGFYRVLENFIALRLRLRVSKALERRRSEKRILIRPEEADHWVEQVVPVRPQVGWAWLSDPVQVSCFLRPLSGDRARVVIACRAVAPGLFARALKEVVGKVFRKNMSENLERMNTLLESEGLTTQVLDPSLAPAAT